MQSPLLTFPEHLVEKDYDHPGPSLQLKPHRTLGTNPAEGYPGAFPKELLVDRRNSTKNFRQQNHHMQSANQYTENDEKRKRCSNKELEN